MAHAWEVYEPGMQVPEWMAAVKSTAQAGMLGVNFFFVLSGFLITALLITEEKRTGTFSMIKYYLRRTLRIWPLYYLVVIGSFVIAPLFMQLLQRPWHETANIWYYLLFINNFYIIRHGFPYSPVLAVLWSIAVEEQFYVAWPWLMKWMKRNRQLLFLLLILASVAFRVIYHDNSKVLYFHPLSIVSDFAIGGGLYYLLHTGNIWLQKIINLSAWKIVIIYALIFVMGIFQKQIFSDVLMITLERIAWGIAFAFIIIEQVAGSNSPVKFGNIQAFNWLGKISYGLYCFHPLALILARQLLQKLNIFGMTYGHFLLFPVIGLAVTIIFAAISFYGYEQWFLRWKKKFEVVLTRPGELT